MPGVKRTVLLFGKAGGGKSTVGNILLSEDSVENGGPLRTGNSMSVVTRHPKRQSTDDKLWTVIDTAGLDSTDPDTSDESLVRELTEFTKGELVHSLCYVKKATKFTSADARCWKLFQELLGKRHQHKEHVLLVFTWCKDRWMEDNDAAISQLMGSEYKRIGVDFPPFSGNSVVETELQKERVTQRAQLIQALEEAPPVGIVLEYSSSWFSGRVRAFLNPILACGVCVGILTLAYRLVNFGCVRRQTVAIDRELIRFD